MRGELPRSSLSRLTPTVALFGYDREMGKSLSFDSILAALAVLSVNAVTAGCSKSEPAAGAPETNMSATDKRAAASSTGEIVPPTPSVAAAAAIATGEAGDAHPAIDAGVERLSAPAPKPTAPARANGSASAACGAQGCSPDMKKGNK